MKNKNILRKAGVFLIMAFMVFSTTIVVGITEFIKEKGISVLSERGNTLIADSSSRRVIEVDNNGSIVWEYSTGLSTSWDTERLDNDNTLITKKENHSIIEVDYYGNIVWEKSTGLNYPLDAERLDNGNTLITDRGNNRIIEVDYYGNIVWEITGLNIPYDAERLDNGNTLITESWGNRVIEVNYSGYIVWEKSTGLDSPLDADRLDNGNTLITDYIYDLVIEVDYYGTIVWEITGLNSPTDAERINRPPYQPSNPNPEDGATDVNVDADLSWTCDDPDEGNTLTYDVYFGTDPDPPLEAEGLTDTSYEPGTMDFNTQYYWKIIAIDNHGASTEGSIWYFTSEDNGPPDAPLINGPTSGNAGNTYPYTFVSKDPNGDDVYYQILWGDGTWDEWIGPYGSDEIAMVNHTWSEQGTYLIYARGKDVYGDKGEWATLTVTMPRSRAINTPFLNFLHNHQNLFPFLQRFFQRLGIL